MTPCAVSGSSVIVRETSLANTRSRALIVSGPGGGGGEVVSLPLERGRIGLPEIKRDSSIDSEGDCSPGAGARVTVLGVSALIVTLSSKTWPAGSFALT